MLRDPHADPPSPQGSESWEVVEEPRARGSPGQERQRHEGYLLKKRKWPLKGWHKVTGRAGTRSRDPGWSWHDLGSVGGWLQGLLSASLPPKKNPFSLHPQRYFVLENGILKYSTTRQDVSVCPGCGHAASPGGSGLGTPPWPPRERGRGGIFPLTGVPGLPQVLKGKLHGAIDVRQSVMSVNKKAQRVDLDTEDNIYHLKVPLGGTGAGVGQGWGHQVVFVPPPTRPCPPRSSPRSCSPAG